MKPSTKKRYKQVGNILFKAERLTNDIQIDPVTNCHVWQGGTHRQGYGMMGYTDARDDQKFMTVVHRLAMVNHLNRELDSQEFVIHTCNNPKCVNPDHLLLGDSKKRYEIMIEKGYEPQHHGINKVRGVSIKQNRNYRYSEDEIRWIRTATNKEIAERYNITRVRAGNLKWGMRNGFKWCK